MSKLVCETTRPSASFRCAAVLHNRGGCDRRQCSYSGFCGRKDHMEIGNQLILLGAGLIVLSIFAGLVSSRIGAPLLLVFLGLGMLARSAEHTSELQSLMRI